MNDVVTDWSHALAKFLVSTFFMLFLAILAMFHIALDRRVGEGLETEVASRDIIH